MDRSALEWSGFEVSLASRCSSLSFQWKSEAPTCQLPTPQQAVKGISTSGPPKLSLQRWIFVDRHVLKGQNSRPEHSKCASEPARPPWVSAWNGCNICFVTGRFKPLPHLAPPAWCICLMHALGVAVDDFLHGIKVATTCCCMDAATSRVDLWWGGRRPRNTKAKSSEWSARASRVINASCGPFTAFPSLRFLNCLLPCPR